MLQIDILSARDLPNLDEESRRAKLQKKLGRLFGRKTEAGEDQSLTDSYVSIDVDKIRLAYTTVINESLNPDYNQSFWIPVSDDFEEVEFRVKDEDLMSAQLAGAAELKGDYIRENPEGIDEWLHLKKKGLPSGKLHVKVKYLTQEEAHNSSAVPGPACFPQRNGCDMKLYADAHDEEDADNRYFFDCLTSLQNAKHVIYITGWSVWTKLALTRGPDSQSLGDLLKEKAEGGVNVMVLIWDEATSVTKDSNSMLDGLMGTFDEETRSFFKGTKVHLGLAQRVGEGVYSTTFTHHQKTVICDEEIPGSDSRRLVGYIGGLDLTTGRFDTGEHSLFKTLKTSHANDFYQNCCAPPVALETGPRQPWHDIHAQVHGDIARDLVSNFEQRWHKQMAERVGCLPNLDRASWLDTSAPYEGAKSNFDCQMLRSINDNGAAMDGFSVDRTVQLGYINTIRRAERYLFVENQYFIGSSQAWFTHYGRPPCNNIVPLEIAKKVISKIRAGEPFSAYIFIPMFPEGIPNSKAVQEILCWQYKTVGMIYQMIGNAIKEVGVDAHPTDYVTVFCLGNREARTGDDPTGLHPCTKSRRFLIYIHSKMLITDDKTIIVGSANINDRSMSGIRDSEIAVCGDEVGEGNTVQKFRQKLWKEHFGELFDEFSNPESIECMRKTRQLAMENWHAYTASEPQDLPHGHALLYPYVVEENGDINPTVACFPDHDHIGAKVKGSRSFMLPDMLTT